MKRQIGYYLAREKTNEELSIAANGLLLDGWCLWEGPFVIYDRHSGTSWHYQAFVELIPSDNEPYLSKETLTKFKELAANDRHEYYSSIDNWTDEEEAGVI